MNNKRLKRSDDRQLAGVCGGIAEFLGWQSSAVRALWVTGTILSGGSGFIIYTLLAYAMPPPDA